MRASPRLFLVALGVFALVGVTLATFGDNASVTAASTTVRVQQTNYCDSNGANCNSAGHPKVVNANVGDAITWQWFSGIHTATSCSGSYSNCTGAKFSSPDIRDTNQAFMYTIQMDDDDQTILFHCQHHSSMQGIILVGSATL